MKWNDEADHGIKENLLAVANGFTVILPALASIGAGIVRDKVDKVKARRHAVPPPPHRTAA